ncbi:hypothetical protein KJ567_04410 [Candidatus Bipolaricaulota bacterium]|nr:hypothetical protein [Candidatus Bipolaricaulota bacterium]
MDDVYDQLSPQLRERIDRCRAEIVDLDLVLRGTVAPYYTTCGKKGCRCQANPPILHGPYYQWTSKVDGKTKTIRLRKDDVELFKQLVAKGRRLDRIVAEWLQLSIEAAQEIREISRR